MYTVESQDFTLLSLQDDLNVQQQLQTTLDPTLNRLRTLGAEALDLLKDGGTIPPSLYVDMLCTKIRSLAGQMVVGWLLLGFPYTLEEHRLFLRSPTPV